MSKIRVSQANRGQVFEDLINFTNEQYKNNGTALVHKRPTPVKVLRTQGNRIVSAVYDSKSTVDYDGVYHGRAIYFEAKSTREKTRFNLSNISNHQIEHLEKAEANGAICFLLIEFAVFHEVYFVPFSIMRHYLVNASLRREQEYPLSRLCVICLRGSGDEACIARLLCLRGPVDRVRIYI